jgi:hypothetical protein
MSLLELINIPVVTADHDAVFADKDLGFVNLSWSVSGLRAPGK